MKKDLSSYVMNTEELIRKLQGSNLFAECPSCGGEFKLSKSLLFDGRSLPRRGCRETEGDDGGAEEKVTELKNRKMRATLVAENKPRR